ncbi:MAG: TraR/DksA C4-type zinc finger protein [Flavobacteriales bacterium]|nr:TraR/DksA C4-type zinc finger protein [Flavobacteriales bacterium]MBK6752998.1 TraR/DksA C4-type zinc finger protein [Flavobacteriales bacterium]MBK7268369.1 TraR/DksA C4-type zinc finger protein [Flavobacteriales bacterium]MBK9077461.1 TraR/DksA C4-type zinc finger protein [Flavobacteriales bacterium]MBK9539012.1 TraR/DksA C4-type zinc finger protein [Flavobacteriales bacterium]
MRTTTNTLGNDRTVTFRYTAEELAEFGTIIRAKLSVAEEGLRMASESLSHHASNGTEDTYAGHKGLEEGNSSLEREELMLVVTRQQKFIKQLNLALERIRLGNYGICRVSGARIPKERLLLVPHTTTCIAVKHDRSPTT